MAYCIIPAFHISTIPRLSLPPSPRQPSIRASISGPKFLQSAKCMAIATPTDDQTIVRRVGNYHPPIWEYDYLQSLTSKYQGDSYTRRANELKEEVRMMLNQVEDPVRKLELIDTLQRLGVYYHFEVEIKRILESINDNYYSSSDTRWNEEDLYATALKFRLLRQYGYHVPQEIFNSFKDECGNFKACLCEDTRGMLYLYEASYLSKSGESTLDEARDFTTKHLQEYLNKNVDNKNDVIFILVSHALELPLHWRMVRLEARWFIDVYEKTNSKNTTMLEFAKLDFNIVQAIHQEELKDMSRWWKSTRLGEKLNFARDRLVNHFLWTVGFNFEPRFQYCRRMVTKVNSLITTIDDIYDVYGTLDELELFTSVVEKWDINAMEQLPDYMKIIFLALYNSINEMAYDALKDQNSNIISFLKKAWVDLCKCYLVEAKWYHSGYTPTLEEYLENAWISIGAPAILMHSYFSVSNHHSKDALECLEKYSNLFRRSSMALRLLDDLGTSKDEMKKGDNPKSIQCYMHQTGASEDEAREHIRYLISENWKKMNEDRVFNDSAFNQTFVGIAMNVARMAQCMYGHGDGHGNENLKTKDRVISLFIEPISQL
ncbi:hypothetical protein LguiB_004448 [Lonicera macranthoides]